MTPYSSTIIKRMARSYIRKNETISATRSKHLTPSETLDMVKNRSRLGVKGLAAAFKVGKSTVYRRLKRTNETGSPERKKMVTILGDEECKKFLIEKRLTDLFITASELSALLRADLRITASKQTVNRFFKEQGWRMSTLRTRPFRWDHPATLKKRHDYAL